MKKNILAIALIAGSMAQAIPFHRATRLLRPILARSKSIFSKDNWTEVLELDLEMFRHVVAGRFDEAIRCVDKGCNPSCTKCNYLGSTAIHQAAISPDKKNAIRFVQAAAPYANLTVKDSVGETAMFEAIRQRNYLMAKTLYKNLCPLIEAFHLLPRNNDERDKILTRYFKPTKTKMLIS